MEMINCPNRPRSSTGTRGQYTVTARRRRVWNAQRAPFLSLVSLAATQVPIPVTLPRTMSGISPTQQPAEFYGALVGARNWAAYSYFASDAPATRPPTPSGERRPEREANTASYRRIMAKCMWSNGDEPCAALVTIARWQADSASWNPTPIAISNLTSHLRQTHGVESGDGSAAATGDVKADGNSAAHHLTGRSSVNDDTAKQVKAVL